MKYLKKSFLLLTWGTIFFSCQNPHDSPKVLDDNIVKVSFASQGSCKGCINRKLVITTDSLVYVEDDFKSKYKQISSTRRTLWDSIIKSIVVNDFDRVKNGAGDEATDGVDVIITIEKSSEDIHSLFNGYKDSSSYKSIVPFVGILQNEIKMRSTKEHT